MPGHELTVVRVRGVDVALAVCEDLWQDGGPVAKTRSAGAELLLVINASPYERNKDDTRLALATRRAREAGCSLAYVNLVGGQDELVFDGDSMVVNVRGDVLARGPQFREDLLVVDLDLKASTVDPCRLRRACSTSSSPRPSSAPYPPLPAPEADRLDDVAEVYAALGPASVTTSARTASAPSSWACPAASTRRWWPPSRPTRSAATTSSASRCPATTPASTAATTPPTWPGGSAPTTGSSRSGRWSRPSSTSWVSPASRRRTSRPACAASILMGLSNAEGHLVLATSNKSELAVGYSTLYGDSVGGFAPLKDVEKTLVWELARWRNAEALRRGEVEPIPESSIVKPPSAELRPGQTDQDSLPPYDVLDPVLEAYVERAKGRSELLAARASTLPWWTRS